MYKHNEASFKKAVLALYQLDSIKEIKKNFDEKSIECMNICFPKLESQQNKIHFIISGKKALSFFEIAELTVSVEDILKYDGVIIELESLFKEGSVEGLLDHFVPFSVENFKAIQVFLKAHYPQFFKQSFSTPFWENEGDAHVEDELDQEALNSLKKTQSFAAK